MIDVAYAELLPVDGKDDEYEVSSRKDDTTFCSIRADPALSSHSEFAERSTISRRNFKVNSRQRRNSSRILQYNLKISALKISSKFVESRTFCTGLLN